MFAGQLRTTAQKHQALHRARFVASNSLFESGSPIACSSSGSVAAG